jgi:hypothetical protein
MTILGAIVWISLFGLLGYSIYEALNFVPLSLETQKEILERGAEEWRNNKMREHEKAFGCEYKEE